MSVNQAQSLLEAALALPMEQRVEIAEGLWASLDANAQSHVDAAQVHEAQRRVQAVMESQLPVVQGEPVLEKLRQSRRP